MSTSIIVPLFNHLTDLTIPFVERVIKTTGKWELVLVDNASTDDTWEWLNNRFKGDKRIKLIHNDINTGFGGGNNTGYRHAVMPRICFISNDVVINDFDWLKKFNKVLDTEPKSLIGPQLVTTNQLTNYKNIPTPYLTGHCIFGSKELFDKVSPTGEVWDESFGVAYFEDVWLSVQSVDLGYQLKEVPVDLNHLGSKSSDKFDIGGQTEKNQIVFHNKMTKREILQKKTKRIVFFASGVPYQFIDDDYEGKGVGGAEASLILLSRKLAELGYIVEIYNNNELTGKFGGVEYKNINEFIYTDYCDVFILFRSYHPSLDLVNASLKIFWSCDQTTDFGGIWDYCIFPNIDLMVTISKYHEEYIKDNYLTKNLNIKTIDLGINGKDYQDRPNKILGRAIYCSVPARGLERLARLTPIIKSRVPNFELIITSDYRLWGLDNPDNYVYLEMFRQFDYVKFVGKVSRTELVEYQKSSQIMSYPSNYPECFCISAMECLAAGAVPVTIDYGALKTTVGKGGVVLSNTATDDDYVNSVVSLLGNKNRLKAYRQEGYKIAEKHDWSVIVNEWTELFKETTMAYTIQSLAQELLITTASVKRVLGIPYLISVKAPISDTQVSEVRTAVKNESELIEKLDAKDFVRQKDYKRMDNETRAKIRAELKLPAAVMPKKTMIAIKVPVNVSINGVGFNSVQSKDGRYHQLEVPYENLPSIIQIIKEAYGDVIL